MLKRLLFLGPTVLVFAHLACTDVNRLAEPDDVMVLSAEPAAITADGFSTTTITVRISRAADERYRDVIFITTNGTFVASTTEDSRRIVVAADTSGQATASLRAAPQAGTATVTAEIRDGQAVKVARIIYWGESILNKERRPKPGEPEWWATALAKYYGQGGDETAPVDAALARHIIEHLGPWQKLFPILGWTQRVVPLRQGRGFFDVE